jgi:hypothetical protein
MKQVILSLFLCFILLPSMDAQQTVGLFVNDSLSQNGYTFWTSRQSSWLIDNCGHLVNKWDHDLRPGLSAYLLENGNLIRAGIFNEFFFGPGSGGVIQEFDWDGNLLWSYQVANTNFKQHHDIEPLPNGNILLIAWERKSPSEVSDAGSSKVTEYWSEMILELEKVGTNDARIVWKWHLWDHLVQDFDETKENYGVVSDHPELLDINYIRPSSNGFGAGNWFHFNSIDYDSFRDEIILSSRTMNEIYIIDHSTSIAEAASHSGGIKGKGGDLLYRWGNPEAYRAGSPADQKLFGQHNPEVVPEGLPGAGNITIFNNGHERPAGSFSSIEEIVPPRDEDGNYVLTPGTSFKPDAPSWQYFADPPESFYAINISGVQRMPNGNTLICDGVYARFFEVNKASEIVWDYVSPVGISGLIVQGTTGGDGARQNVFRARKYLPDFPGFTNKDMTPGEVIELEPWTSDCEIYEEVVSSNIEIQKLDGISIAQDFNNQFLLIDNNSKEELILQMFDLRSQLFASQKIPNGESKIDLFHFPPAMYIVLLTDSSNGKYYAKKISKN